MAQGYDKYELDNQTGQSFRFALNDILEAVATQNSGDNSPNTTNTSYPYQTWVDTTNDVVKIRDAATAGTWYSLYSVDANGQPTGAVATGSYSISTNDTGGTGGTTAIFVDTSQRVGIGTATVPSLLSLQQGSDDSYLRFRQSSEFDTGSVGHVIDSRNTAGNANTQLTLRGNPLTFWNNGEAARIDSAGRLGIGTTDPQHSLSLLQGNALGWVSGAGNAKQKIEATGTDGLDFYTGGTPTLKATIDSSGRVGIGTTAAPSELVMLNGSNIAALIRTSAAVGTAQLKFNADDVNYAGIGLENTALVLRCSNSATPVERMRITSAGQINLGDAAIPGASKVFAKNSASSTTDIVYYSELLGGSHSVNASHFFAITQGYGVWRLTGNGTSTFTSDERKKKNIETTRDGYLEDLRDLRVVKYNWINQDDDTPKELGLIAQEVEQIFPGLVAEEAEPMEGDDYKLKALKGSVLPFMLLKALQEAAEKIETLEAKVAALEGA